MSLFNVANITCAKCGHVYTMDVVGSVNADRRPDLREDILADRFQDSECPECKNRFRMEPLFSYADVGRNQWIACMPARDMARYRAGEASAKALFERSYGPGAPKAAREVGETLMPRVTFGWPAVREKLLIRELDLDDVVVEEVKLDLMRRIPRAPMQAGIEIRLIGMDDDRMRFQWLGSEDESIKAEVSIGKELYDVIAGNPDEWKEVRELLTDGYFIDMQKMYMDGA